MEIKNLIVLGLLIGMVGCATTSLPKENHIKTTKKITLLEEEGYRLEAEGKEKLQDLIETLNSSIN
jgi:hypothetical protein